MSGDRSELEEFMEAEPIGANAPDAVVQQVSRDLLLFDYDGDLYGVDAMCVVGVVPFRAPAPVPGADSRVRGVIQDRGRVVVLLSHPASRVSSRPAREVTRIVVCATARGHVGLPAVSTRTVITVGLASEPTALSVYESGFGPFIYLDPTRYGDQQAVASM